MAVQTLFPLRSAYVSQFYPNQDFPQPPNLYFGRFHGVGDIYRTLIQFPANTHHFYKTVLSAVLELTISRNEIPPGTVVSAGLQRALNPWTKFVTWNSQPGFNLFETFYVSAADSPGTVLRINVTDIVRRWMDGSWANDGFVITGNEVLDSLVGIANTGMFPLPLSPGDLPFSHDDLSPCEDGGWFDDGFLFDHRRRQGVRPTLFVQTPPGSLHYERAETLGVGPRLVIKFGRHHC